MNLEQIDTSTTAGKIRVMELAEQGRKVAYCARSVAHWTSIDSAITWNWHSCDYAIIAEPVGPEEVWLALLTGGQIKGVCETEEEANYFGLQSVRYIRADLAGEEK